jgi:hypothetical protein
MVQQVQFQQIGQPGLGASAAILGQRSGMLNQNSKNKTDLINSLIGGGSRIGTQVLAGQQAEDLQKQKEPFQLLNALDDLGRAEQQLRIQGDVEGADRVKGIMAQAGSSLSGLGGQSQSSSGFGGLGGLLGGIGNKLGFGKGQDIIPQAQQAPVSSGGLQGLLPPSEPIPVQTSKTPEPGIQPRIPRSSDILPSSTNLPFNQAQSKTVTQEAEARPIVERQLEGQQQFVTNIQTGIVASQPIEPGATEREPIVLTPIIRERQAAMFDPTTGKLNETGKEVAKNVALKNSVVNKATSLMEEAIRLENSTGLNIAEKGLLSAGGVELLAVFKQLSPQQRRQVTNFKQKYDSLQADILSIAARVNQGRPTDKDFVQIAKGFPELFSSKEKTQRAGVDRLVQLYANLAEDEILVSKTANFNKTVDKLQSISRKKYEFGEPISLNDEELQQAVNHLLGDDMPRNSIQSFDTQLDTGDKSITLPSEAPTPKVDQGDLLQRLNNLQKQGVF